MQRIDDVNQSILVLNYHIMAPHHNKLGIRNRIFLAVGSADNVCPAFAQAFSDLVHIHKRFVASGFWHVKSLLLV